MRPLKLTLTAFGPYHQTETIDFEALKPYDLFVISGNTGAGKTTIFDGISYALFGGASGEDRKEAISLRSDFAPDDLPTTAELLFSLRGKNYRIFRQLPYLKSGNKSITPGKAELYEIDLDNQDLFNEINAVDRQITSEVDKKIFELLGLNKAQFNQLVMLPQGEYQRFLTSSTNDKEAILRTVFNTEKYQTLIQNLKIRRDEQQQIVLQLSAAQAQLLQSLFTQLPARDSLLFSYQRAENGELKTELPLINPQQALNGLTIETAHYQTITTEITDHLQQKREEIQKLQTEIAQAESIHQGFQQLQATELALQKHQESTTEIQNTRQKITLAEQAQPIEHPFESVTRLREETKIALTNLKQSESQLSVDQTSAENAQKQYALELAKEAERTELTADIVMLESNQARVESLAKLQIAQQTLTESNNVLQTQITEKKATITQKNDEKLQLTTALQTAEKFAKPVFSLATLQQKLIEVESLFVTQKNRESELLSLKSSAKNRAEIAEKAQAQLDIAYQTWIDNQAKQLAESLNPGDQCPVCGSKEHPALHSQQILQSSQHDSSSAAQTVSEQLIMTPKNADEQLSAAQKAAISANAQAQQLQLQLTQLTAEISKQQPLITQKLIDIQNFWQSEDAAMLSDIDLPVITAEISLSELEAVITFVKNASQIATENHRTATKQREAINAQNEEISQLREALEIMQASQHQLEQELATKNAEIATITALIPAELQDIKHFQYHLQSKKSSLAALKSALEMAQQAKTKCEQQLAVSQHHVTTEKARVEQLVNAGKKARRQLDEALLAAGFSQEDSNGQTIADEAAFIKARLEHSQIKILREAVQQYDQQLEIYQRQIAELKTRLKDQTLVDLTELQATLETAETIFSQLNTALADAKHALKIIQDATTKIGKNRQKLETESDALHKIMEVHDLLRGDNPQKLSFERYILIEYFEQVIAAANLRLQKMTNGQFEFIRSENLASHGKQSGLDLDIYDAYTGEARDVKTLSGGEKFKASLSLSLGMADTIQAHQGGISIETLFIDEGFGSLDEESLLQALDVLIELQDSGKMIGVISHVEELKQTLPARIEVTKTKGGFSKTQIITQDSH